MTGATPRITFELPDWAAVRVAETSVITDLHDRMAFVVETARLNVERRSGGPFAAAVFERDTGALVSLGVNLVTTAGLSMLHAEIVAIALAQRKLGGFDLAAPGLPAHELVSSAEPCAMCLGATPWSGVTRVVIGARGEDVESVGFDEGAKPDNWLAQLTARGIDVVCDVHREPAAKVIRDYVGKGGAIYNPDLSAKA